MMRVLEGLKPEKVFYYFEELTKIPRGSGNEKAVSDYLVHFAKQRGLKVRQDEAYNVVIWQKATPGYENHPGVILQGHMDMVCVKKERLSINMETDPLDLAVEGDYIFARGTSLGGDDGIAVAMALAILDDETIPHPPLEVIITTDEEVGMTGASRLNPEGVEGRLLINIDSEDEGILTAGCAGGLRVDHTLKVQKESTSLSSGLHDSEQSEDVKNKDVQGVGLQRADVQGGMQVVQLLIHGLKGGHSGIEIGKERANAMIELARCIDLFLDKEGDACRLIAFNGGEKDNAIPLRATAEMVIPSAVINRLQEFVESHNQLLGFEYALSDPEIEIVVNSVDGFSTVSDLNTNMDSIHHSEKEHEKEKSAKETTGQIMALTPESAKNFLNLILTMPNGIQHMSMAVPGLPETSLNMGIVRLEKDSEAASLTQSIRSSISSRKGQLLRKVSHIAAGLGASSSTRGDYPAWEFRPESRLRNLVCETYEQLFGKKMTVDIIHAGLECGLLSEKLPGLDAISIGPDLKDIHTTKEKMSISSTIRTFQLVCEVLSRV